MSRPLLELADLVRTAECSRPTQPSTAPPLLPRSTKRYRGPESKGEPLPM